jgi:hypothetical protein
MTIALRLTASMREAPQAQPLPPSSHRGLHDHLAAGADEKGLSAVVEVLD